MLILETNRVMHLSTSASTANYNYTQVYVAGSGPYNVIFNGIAYPLAGPITLDLFIDTIQSGNPNVYLLGFVRNDLQNYQNTTNRYFNE